YVLLVNRPKAGQTYVKAASFNSVGLGSSVALSGDTLVVGAPSDRGVADISVAGPGAVYVFVRSAGRWAQQARLLAPNPTPGDNFGHAVALEGNTLVIGMPYDDSAALGVGGSSADDSRFNSGAAYVFVRSGTTWSVQAYLKPATASNENDYFGWGVSLSGDTVVVTAPGEDSAAVGVGGDVNDNTAIDSGAAYVYVRSGSTWSFQAYLKASNTGRLDAFGGNWPSTGGAVAVSGDLVLIGAPKEDSGSRGVGGVENDETATDSGAAYLFRRTGTAWAQAAYVKASNSEANDLFGTAVALRGTLAAVGAPQESSSATGIGGSEGNGAPQSGAVYLFSAASAQGPWQQTAYVKATNTESFDGFGASVALAEGRLMVGAPGERGGSTGVDGEPHNNAGGSSTGAAYVLAWAGGRWRHEAYVKAMNPGAQDFFGASVAVSPNTAAAGAPQEDGASVGVQGPFAETGPGFGAAYVYE
ncbi:MAG: integrin, partial [Myxococcaceae bacterium]|nr:integrin [Myxococcaceae bacterium]